jgi:ribokinase
VKPSSAATLGPTGVAKVQTRPLLPRARIRQKRGLCSSDALGTTKRAATIGLGSPASGIDVTSLMSTCGVLTGSAVIAVSPSDGNTIILSSGANALLGTGDLVALEELGPQDVVVTTLEVSISVVQKVAEYAEHAGARFVLNFSPIVDVPERIIQQSDPLMVNAHENVEVTRRYGEVSSRLVTRGDSGSDWNGIHVPALSAVPVVDTTVAGDAYCGAFSLALAEGAEAEAAMRVATIAASHVITRVGAQ